jgi:hypothetical protein
VSRSNNNIKIGGKSEKVAPRRAYFQFLTTTIPKRKNPAKSKKR